MKTAEGWCGPEFERTKLKGKIWEWDTTWSTGGHLKFNKNNLETLYDLKLDRTPSDQAWSENFQAANAIG